MSTINENLKFYGSYFHRIKDTIQCKSTRLSGLGACLSSFTGVVPIIFGVGYFIAKSKLQELERFSDKLSQSLIGKSKLPFQVETR